jgi:hypothetical protein
VTELGIVIDVNDSQFLNALFPIEVTELESTIDDNEVQFLNTHPPIDAELGIAIDFNDAHP